MPIHPIGPLAIILRRTHASQHQAAAIAIVALALLGLGIAILVF